MRVMVANTHLPLESDEESESDPSGFLEEETAALFLLFDSILVTMSVGGSGEGPQIGREQDSYQANEHG